MKVNLIGISGKIGSGKDTIGKIIQYLTIVPNPTNIEFINRHINDIHPIHNAKYDIKKYAFKLKQIASLMLGIPVEDFEKQEVKDRVLGEEWVRYGYANGFIQKNGETIMNNESCSKERYEEELKTNWQTAYKSEMTVRQFLQLLGTEAMRNVIHPNAWVNALFADYKPNHPLLHEGKYEFDGFHCICCKKQTKDSSYFICEECLKFGNRPNWIITDVRFPNEKQAIEERNGIVIRVNRGFTTSTGFFILDKSDGSDSEFIPVHPSETALDDASFDYIINNNGTIEELIEEVKEILIKEQII